MFRKPNFSLTFAMLVTLAAVILWQATGGDYYTKFQVVEQIQKQIDPEDPLAATGFYEGEAEVATITRDDFRFGLLPTPSGLWDKHLLSVVTISGPLWALALVTIWRSRRHSHYQQDPVQLRILS
jgi:hypothetical protein